MSTFWADDTSAWVDGCGSVHKRGDRFEAFSDGFTTYHLTMGDAVEYLQRHAPSQQQIIRTAMELRP